MENSTQKEMTHSCGQKFYASERSFYWGDIVNTNAAYIAKELAAIGVNVYHQAVVGDNAQRLREQLERSFSQCDLVVLTGGLGPTYDDLTKETVAELFGREMEFNQEAYDGILRRFSTRTGK